MNVATTQPKMAGVNASRMSIGDSPDTRRTHKFTLPSTGTPLVPKPLGSTYSMSSGLNKGGVGLVSTQSLTKTKLVSGSAPMWTDEFDFELDDGFDAIIIQVNKVSGVCQHGRVKQLTGVHACRERY